ncbi:hypothetical protein JXA85_05455 [Candidatus Woesearchaeota archaeon]|nr:hypothetical protein [Candidatus Woesearchaeota archaeon]
MKEGLLDSVPELTRFSLKGQMVVPSEIRKELHLEEGDIFANALTKDIVLLKRIRNPILQEDLTIIKEAEAAWKEVEEGKLRTMEAKDFLKEIKEW